MLSGFSGAAGRFGAMTLSRRYFLGAAAMAGFATTIGRAAATAIASRRAGFGAAATLVDLKADPRLGEAIAARCTELAPVWELNWQFLRPKRDAFVFGAGDELVAFADSHGLKTRGHSLVWYSGMPDWTREISSARDAERELVRHIETTAGHYRGKLTSWNVVNEPTADDASNDRSYRPCLWSNYLGPRYAEIAFRAAAAADPHAKLMLNEYDVEHVGPRNANRRATLRRMALDLLDAGAPLQAIGLQGHLQGATPIDRDGLSAFVADMRRAGLEVYVTELDVIDRDLPGDPAERDAIIARQVDALLSAASAPAPLDKIVTWGLSDRYSWIPYMLPRWDHLPNRPLPLDADFRPKPFMATIEKFTRAAA
jgi:endo-1,4-beta-xylanase